MHGEIRPPASPRDCRPRRRCGLRLCVECQVPASRIIQVRPVRHKAIVRDALHAVDGVEFVVAAVQINLCRSDFQRCRRIIKRG